MGTDNSRQLQPNRSEQPKTQADHFLNDLVGSACLFSIKLYSRLLTSSRMPPRSIFLGRVHYDGRTGATPQATSMRPGSKRNCEEQPIGASRSLCNIFYKLSLTYRPITRIVTQYRQCRAADQGPSDHPGHPCWCAGGLDPCLQVGRGRWHRRFTCFMHSLTSCDPTSLYCLAAWMGLRATSP
jgi:hypothetical protein